MKAKWNWRYLNICPLFWPSWKHYIKYHFVQFVKRKLKQIELGDQKGKPSYPERKTGRRLPFFAGWTHPVKSHGLYIYYSHPNFISPLQMCPSLGMWELAHGFSCLQTPSCNSQLIPNRSSLLEKYLAAYLFEVNI